MTPEAILAVLLQTTPHQTDSAETVTDRRNRLEPVALAISKASARYADSRGVAAALLVIGRRESYWASYVQEDRCSEGPTYARCDPDKTGKARALGFWQLWKKACPAAWALTPSPERLEAEARCAASTWVGARMRCRDAPDGQVAGAFSGYRSGCLWLGGKPRAHEWAKMVERL
jgi:hypothetical protein